MQKLAAALDSDGVTLRGWFVRPNDADDTPLIILAHGLSGITALDLDEYAEKFVASGFACFAYDHRNWGASDGSPRSETDPWRQVDDMREVISFVGSQPWVDSARIGIWGTSYAGGHVLTVSGLDKRVKCAVSQVPLISGSKTFNAWVPEDKQQKFLQKLASDRDARYNGESPKTVPAAGEGSETAEWIARKDVSNSYVNELTIRSFDYLRTYEPEHFAMQISPTPIMMVIATQDTQTPTEWQRELFAKMSEPKQLVELPGRHYDVYMDSLDLAATAARDWFNKHL